jgi:hypothetical protein
MQIKKQPQTKQEIIEAYIKNIPEKYRGTYRKAMEGSKKKAIDAKCQECMCWQVSEIKRCENMVCPLFPNRPGAKKSDRYSIVDSGAD